MKRPRFLPKVEWATNEFLEKEGGYKRKFNDSIVQGMVIYYVKEKTCTIYLGLNILERKHRTWRLFGCLWHEYMHYLFDFIPNKYYVFSDLLDRTHRFIEVITMNKKIRKV